MSAIDEGHEEEEYKNELLDGGMEWEWLKAKLMNRIRRGQNILKRYTHLREFFSFHKKLFSLLKLILSKVYV